MIDTTRTFKALADPTRQSILQLLADGPRTIGAVAENFDMTRAGVAKHLRLLEEGRLIVVTPSGRERINALCPEGFALARDWVSAFDSFWDDKIAALQAAVDANRKTDKET